MVFERRVKRKRSKALVLTLLPALIFIGFMGWLMYALAPKHHAPQKPLHQTTLRRDEAVSFLPAIYETQQKIGT